MPHFGCGGPRGDPTEHLELQGRSKADLKRRRLDVRLSLSTGHRLRPRRRRLCAIDRDRGGALQLRPSHTTVHTGPYTAVREVALTRFDQGRETERVEVGIGEPDGEGSASGEIPRTAAAAGRVTCCPRRDSPRDECR